MNEIYALCKLYGSLLLIPKHIDGPRFMAAIAWNESSCGKNVAPRYESSYDIGGQNYRNEQIDLVAHSPKDDKGRSLAAFSYGPWQMLPCNAKGFLYSELRDESEKAAQAFMGFVNRYIFRERNPQNFDQLCQCYNAGHFVNLPTPGVVRYVEDAWMHYGDPEVIAGVTA